MDDGDGDDSENFTYKGAAKKKKKVKKATGAASKRKVELKQDIVPGKTIIVEVIEPSPREKF